MGTQQVVAITVQIHEFCSEINAVSLANDVKAGVELFSGLDCSFGDERFEKETVLLRSVRGDSTWVMVVFKNGTSNGGEIDS